jgi:hypothetical protein
MVSQLDAVARVENAEQAVRNMQRGQSGLEHPIARNPAQALYIENSGIRRASKGGALILADTVVPRIEALELAVQELGQKAGMQPPFEPPSTWTRWTSSTATRMETLVAAVSELENFRREHGQAVDAEPVAPRQNVEAARAAAREVARTASNTVAVDHSHDGTSIGAPASSPSGPGRGQDTGIC